MRLGFVLLFLVLITGCSTCKYSMKDTSPIPAEVKSFRVTHLENRAPYVNPQLSPQLTERLKQKIIQQTRLRQTNSDEAHYDISGYVTDYTVTTTGITNNNASTNRLNVSFHLIFRNTLDQKGDLEADLTRTFDFDARLNLSQAEATLFPEIVKNIVDEIFNKIFSNW